MVHFISKEYFVRFPEIKLEKILAKFWSISCPSPSCFGGIKRLFPFLYPQTPSL
jgi:hypothetical protein